MEKEMANKKWVLEGMMMCREKHELQAWEIRRIRKEKMRIAAYKASLTPKPLVVCLRKCLNRITIFLHLLVLQLYLYCLRISLHLL